MVWSRIQTAAGGTEAAARSGRGGRSAVVAEMRVPGELASTSRTSRRSVCFATSGCCDRRGPGIDDELEVYHDQIGETLRERLAVDTRCEHHRRLALELEAAGRTDPETLAYHFAQRRSAVASRAVLSPGGIQAVRAMAFDRAADLFRRALEIGAWPFPTEGRLEGRAGGRAGELAAGARGRARLPRSGEGVPERESIELRRRGVPAASDFR